MKQFIVINAETANKYWVSGSPSLLPLSASIAPFIVLKCLGEQALGEVFGRLSAGLF